jgi:hypothetical protein
MHVRRTALHVPATRPSKIPYASLFGATFRVSFPFFYLLCDTAPAILFSVHSSIVCFDVEAPTEIMKSWCLLIYIEKM